MAQLLQKILLNYSVEEMSSPDDFRLFAVPVEDNDFENEIIHVELFSYSDTKKIFIVKGIEYKDDDKDLEAAINQEFNVIESDYKLLNVSDDKYKNLSVLSKKISIASFNECKELNSLQREIDDPSRLEHFTDWVTDYAEETGLWQVRFPMRLYQFMGLSEEKNTNNKNKAFVNRIFSFAGLLEPLEKTRFFLIKSIYHLQDKQTLDMRLSEDAVSDDTEVYFIGIGKTDNPLDDNLDEWYGDIFET